MADRSSIFYLDHLKKIMSLQLLLMALCLWVIFPIAVSNHVSTPSESGKVKNHCLL